MSDLILECPGCGQRKHPVSGVHFPHCGACAPPPPLGDALAQLAAVDEYADEIGVPRPSPRAIRNARRLLKEMHQASPREYGVYPTAYGRVHINARNGRGNSVVVSCDSDGGVRCLAHVGADFRQAQYDSARNLPDEFIRTALAGL